MEETLKKKKKIFRGTVVSDSMDKTIVVQFERTYKNVRTGKITRARKKYKVHDEHEVAKLGDVVNFYEGRPIAKTKYMYLDGVVKTADLYES